MNEHSSIVLESGHTLKDGDIVTFGSGLGLPGRYKLTIGESGSYLSQDGVWVMPSHNPDLSSITKDVIADIG